MSPSPTPPKRLDCHGDIFQLQCGLRYRDAHHDSALHTCNCCNGTSSDKGKRKSLSTLLTLLCVWQKRRERDFKNRNIERKKVKKCTLFLFFLPSHRCTGCIGAEAEACSALRTSGPPECGRAPRCEKPGSTLLPTQPRVPVCPSTLLQCPVTLTTVTGSSLEWPLGGDR